MSSGAPNPPDESRRRPRHGWDPLIVAPVHVVSGATQYEYHAAFVPPGDYTVAFTCSDDDPTANDATHVLAGPNTTVQNNLISTVNFAPPPRDPEYSAGRLEG